MKEAIGLFIAVLSLSACGQNDKQRSRQQVDSPTAQKTTTAENDYEPRVTIVKYEELLQALHQQNDTLNVVNFWATWCIPCVKELPYFVATVQAMKNKPVKLVLVSLDQRNNLDTVVVPFLRKKNLIAQHYLLDDNGRMNEWIPKIDADWDGVIPATALYKNGRKLRFDQGQLSESELKANIQSHL